VVLIFGKLTGGKKKGKVINNDKIIIEFYNLNWYLNTKNLKFHISLGLNIKDPNAQQMCANLWKELDDSTRIHFENEAKKIKNLKDNESYIFNAKARKSKLDKTIQEMRKMVFFL
jgi:hypothetical protein